MDFRIEKIGQITKITNNTKYIAVIRIKPIPPKRKYDLWGAIFPEEFCIFDENVNVERISISFERKDD